MNAGQNAARDLAALLRARNPLIWITTREETRAERGILEACQIAQYAPIFQDCASGFTTFDGKTLDAGMTDPGAALAAIRDSSDRSVYIMRDLANKWLDDPTISRAVRSLARSLQLAPRDKARAIIILTPRNEIPPELAGQAIALDWPLPDRAEIAEILDAAIAALPDDLKATAAPNGTRDAAIDAAVGLTHDEAQACYSKSLVTARKIDPAAVAQEKKRVIGRERVLEWYDPLPGGLDSVGGLDILKAWLNERREAYTPKARAYGLPAPKGCLLIGVPGCGKSLTAKAIATAWQVPLLRLDMGALKSKYVGESEANIRKALKVVDTVGRCVLWLDEIEKAITSGPSADGGVSSDALGTVLTWMQDRTSSVFVVATANDVSQLPAPLMRKGRFDELFFVDLPTRAERAAILQAALAANNRSGTFTNGTVGALAAASQGFSGAELAALIPSAMFTAFADGERGITAADVHRAIAATVTLSKTAPEEINKIRQWSKGRCQPASTPEETTDTRTPTLDI